VAVLGGCFCQEKYKEKFDGRKESKQRKRKGGVEEEREREREKREREKEIKKKEPCMATHLR